MDQRGYTVVAEAIQEQIGILRPQRLKFVATCEKALGTPIGQRVGPQLQLGFEGGV